MYYNNVRVTQDHYCVVEGLYYSENPWIHIREFEWYTVHAIKHRKLSGKPAIFNTLGILIVLNKLDSDDERFNAPQSKWTGKWMELQ